MADKHEPTTNYAVFPLSNPTIVEHVKEFQAALIAIGTDSLLFANPAKVHLTISELVLEDDEEREKAAEIVKKALNETVTHLGHKGPIIANIQGLAIMNDDPTDVDVLYAECHEPGFVLQKMANNIAKKLADSKLGKPIRGEQVKLHCTLLSSAKKAKYFPDGRDKDYAFDATRILQEFKDYDFGQVAITEIKLTTMDKAAPGEFYKSYRSFLL